MHDLFNTFSARRIWKTIFLLVAALCLPSKEVHAYIEQVPQFGTPLLVGDKLIFAEPGLKPHRLICIAKESGKKLWEITNLQNPIRPWFVLSNQCIVTVGDAVEKCDPTSGQLALLYRTPYEGAIWLGNIQNGHLLVVGETNNVDNLTCLDCTLWRPVWASPRIVRVIASGQDVLLCEQASRRTATNGSYSIFGVRWVALSKKDGKLLWQCPPFAEAAAIDSYFLCYLKDTISCLNQLDGKTVKEFRIAQQPYALASLLSKDQQLLVRTFQMEFDTNNDPKYTFFSLAVPDLQWKKLTKVEWNTVLKAEIDVRDNDYIYFASTDTNWITGINRTEISTGKKEQMYQEPVPSELRTHP
jgi:hypothetical protein